MIKVRGYECGRSVRRKIGDEICFKTVKMVKVDKYRGKNGVYEGE